MGNFFNYLFLSKLLFYFHINLLCYYFGFGTIGSPLTVALVSDLLLFPSISEAVQEFKNRAKAKTPNNLKNIDFVFIINLFKKLRTLSNLLGLNAIQIYVKRREVFPGFFNVYPYTKKSNQSFKLLSIGYANLTHKHLLNT